MENITYHTRKSVYPELDVVVEIGAGTSQKVSGGLNWQPFSIALPGLTGNTGLPIGNAGPGLVGVTGAPLANVTAFTGLFGNALGGGNQTVGFVTPSTNNISSAIGRNVGRRSAKFVWG